MAFNMKYGLICWAICPLLFCACNGTAAKKHTHEGKEFYYYPSKNMYYDVAGHQYIFSLDSGKTWNTMAGQTAAPAIEGNRVTIYSNTDKVWQNNANDIDEYHGRVLDVINQQSLKQQSEPVEPKKSLAQKTADKQEDTVRKAQHKRPLKNFFQKLFGKKKDR